MTNQEFDLEEFRNSLKQLESVLVERVELDLDYEGEANEVIDAIKRLRMELKDKKYQQVLPDLFLVLDFLNLIDEEFEEDEQEDLN